MNDSVVLSNWSIDAFGCLSSKLHKKLSAELISRIETFVTSIVLFDEVFLSENYKNNKIVNELNKKHPGTIKIISSDDLFHSTDMLNHISIELDLYDVAFEELAKENKVWQMQHDPQIFSELLNSEKMSKMLDSNFFTQLRLWHWCYTNEMAELTNSVNMLPLSLNPVGELAFKKKDKTDVILKSYFEYATFHNQKFIRLSEMISTPFISELKAIPPLMTILLERCKSSEDMVDVLANMREEFKDFRRLRHSFTSKIQSSSNIGEQTEIVADWNKAWGQLTAGEFKEPNLLKRKLSSTEVASSIVSIDTGGIKSFITHCIDHHHYRKSYKQFQIFSNLEENINSLSKNGRLLGEKFGVEEIIPLN